MEKEKYRKKEKIEKTKRKRKILVISIGIAIIFSVAAGCFILAGEEVNFEKAMENPELREKYIKKVVKEIGKPENVVNIDYLDTFKEVEILLYRYETPIDPCGLAVTVPTRKVIKPEEWGNATIPVRIFVMPTAFEGIAILGEEDFKSLLELEYHHARICAGETPGADFGKFWTTDGRWNDVLFNQMVELSAFRMSLHSSRKISSVWRQNLINEYFSYYTSIWHLEEGMYPEFIKSLKVDFFEDWMVKHPDLIQDDQWYFQHPVTKKRYYLPEEIKRYGGVA